MQEKILLSCPKCRSNQVMVSRDGKSTRTCSNCSNTWMPNDKNTWRIEGCRVSKDEENDTFNFEIIFEDGHIFCANIKQNSHCFDALNEVKRMLQIWNNGDDILEPKKINQPITNDIIEIKEKSYKNGLAYGCDILFIAINSLRESIVEKNPNPNNSSLIRDSALVILNILERDIRVIFNEKESRNIKNKDKI